MPATPQTASFHVDAVAAQRVFGDVRLLVRTKEVAPFALLFTPALADEIGLRIITPAKPAAASVPGSVRKELQGDRKAGSGRSCSPENFQSYQAVLARMREIGPSANVAVVCREMDPPVSYRNFINWRRNGVVRAQQKAATR